MQELASAYSGDYLHIDTIPLKFNNLVYFTVSYILYTVTVATSSEELATAYIKLTAIIEYYTLNVWLSAQTQTTG